MKVDFKRSFCAPFRTQAPKGLLNIYLIAVGFSIVIFLIHLLFTILGFAGTVFICLIHVVHSLVVLSTQSFEFGYIAETIKLEANNEDFVMPRWEGNYSRFFFKGFQAQLIVVIYYFLSFIPPALLTLVALIFMPDIYNALLSSNTGYEYYSSFAAMGLIFFLLVLFLLISVIIVTLILPMACVRFASRNRFLSAFNLLPIVKSICLNLIDYSLVTIIILLLCIPAGIICLLLCVTIVGWVGVGLLQFLLMIIFFNMYAQVYKDKRLG